ncbi:MAG: alpha/beta hydrolase [Gammaproteobacteria bacterium]|nr:MAG: alpha/beta hydrolase [Gammaproteobacteria bacterium]
MSAGENLLQLEGGAGKIEAILHLPPGDVVETPVQAMMICCHPHPLHGGTMTNKIVHIVCKTFSKMGLPSLRFNFRSIGESEGSHDEGVGESDDLLILSQLMGDAWPDRDLWLAGFSFGSWVAAHSAFAAQAKQLLSIAPPVQHFDFNKFSQPTCPWLVLMGDEDDVVEPAKVYEWVDSQEDNKPELIRFAGAGHFFHGEMVNMSKILENHYRPVLQGS